MNLLVNIDVADLDVAIHFYTHAFDLKVGRKFGLDGAELVGGSAPIYLLVKAPGSRASTESDQLRSYKRHWSPVHLDIVVNDIDASIERAVRAGATLEQAVRSNRWGKLALLADPFGHGFCFVQFVGRGYDEITTSQ